MADISDELLSPTKLLHEVRDLIQQARKTAATTVNTLHVLTNFEIGRLIVEHEQKGEERAGYGQALIKDLSKQLSHEFGRGFSTTNLKLMRKFYLEFHPRIGQKASDLLGSSRKGQKASDLSSLNEKPLEGIRQTPSAKFSNPFMISWSHYVTLLTVEEPDERSFYEIEASNEGWSVPELKRQIASSLYERLALSRDKQGVKDLATRGQTITRPEDIFKEPYVLEFLGLEEHSSYSESDLEKSIISRLEKFILELGKGFLFEARQRRFTFDEDHYFVDLVFYNRLLRCYVLIDLKLGKLTHQDLGQMQMYVNHFDRHEILPEENPTIGILLCKRKNEAVVELTLPPDANIHAKEYQLYLPSKELLKEKLIQFQAEAESAK